ncbi:MAG TPA: AMED_5909 family protein [Pseudonocardiaceae bacterium]|nr:AMED_5909 family protein [Pseudonocardiaceae bacterium]
MSTQKKAAPERPKTLMQAHNALVAIRPKSTASLAVWKAYYERSAALYRDIAEIDRGHHHEALYWADREQKSADEITARINAEHSGPTQEAG